MKIVHHLLEEYQKQVIKGEVPVTINTMDLDRIIKLSLLIQNQPTEIRENKLELDIKNGLKRLMRIEVQYANNKS